MHDAKIINIYQNVVPDQFTLMTPNEFDQNELQWKYNSIFRPCNHVYLWAINNFSSLISYNHKLIPSVTHAFICMIELRSSGPFWGLETSRTNQFWGSSVEATRCKLRTKVKRNRSFFIFCAFGHITQRAYKCAQAREQAKGKSKV